MSGAPHGPRFCGISRILFPLSRDGDHLSHPVSRAPRPTLEAFSKPRSTLAASNASKVVRGATITRGILPAFAGKPGRQPFPSALSCTTWGFSCGCACATPGGLLPRLCTLTEHYSAPLSGRIRRPDLKAVLNSAGRYIFCDTLRHPGFASRMPPLSRGMLPYGVRTFLWQNKCQASDHPPQPGK